MSKDSETAFPAVIRKTPGVIGGDACIGNRRIAVWMLVEDKQLGLSDDEIRNGYEQPLTEAELEAAWAYYEQNHDEIERAIWQNQACMFEQQSGPTLQLKGAQRFLHGTIPLEFLEQGRRLGLDDEQIRDAFEPPLKADDLAAAFRQ
jgi:uncharacterized protein (DUF433 family)